MRGLGIHYLRIKSDQMGFGSRRFKICRRKFSVLWEPFAVQVLLTLMSRLADNFDFEGLVNAYYAMLYQFAFSLTRDEAEACDLVQQTYCIWAEKGHQLRDRSKAKTWLFTTLHREFLGARRRSTRFPHLELELAEAELPTVSLPAITQLDTAQVLQALARLDGIYQAPIALFYLQDYSYNEIAEILDVPVGTIKSRLSRGLNQLHEMLAYNPPPQS